MPQVRSLEVEKAELASDVTMQQDSQNAKAAEVERLRREVASAHAERHAAVQQVPVWRAGRPSYLPCAAATKVVVELSTIC
jgi:hypothetical protein